MCCKCTSSHHSHDDRYYDFVLTLMKLSLSYYDSTDCTIKRRSVLKDKEHTILYCTVRLYCYYATHVQYSTVHVQYSTRTAQYGVRHSTLRGTQYRKRLYCSMYGRSLSYLWYYGRPYSSSMRRRDDRCDAACAVIRYDRDGEETERRGTDTGRMYGASSSAGRAGVWVYGCMGGWVGVSSAATPRCAAAAEPSALRAPRRQLLLQRVRRRDAADRSMAQVV